MSKLRPNWPALAATMLCASALSAQASNIHVTLTNLAPSGGVGIAPLWVGFHDGSFDSFDTGSSASIGIERAAEDGNAGALSAIFASSAPTGTQGTLPGPPAFPGAVRSLDFSGVDLTGVGRYFSYAAMVVLSNDFFIGNDNAKEIDLSSLASGGRLSILVGGFGDVYDAGTEVNNFKDSLANGAFGIGGGQSSANQGQDELGVVHLVTGNPYLSFLGQEYVPAGYQWGALDFNAGPAFARIDIEVAAVPEPGSLQLVLAGITGLSLITTLRKRRSMSANT